MVLLTRGNELEANAPAKLNFHLELLAKRNDGFHELETLMVPVSIYDSLKFVPHSQPTLVVRTRWSQGLLRQLGESLGPLPPMESNLAFRALKSLQAAAQYTGGATIDLVKRIPAQAGLGGASSDAAAALQLANRGWGLDWPQEKLATIAAELGSDVPFFLQRNPAICRGRGERIEPLAGLSPWHVVIVRPPMGLSTPEVYRRCRIPAEPQRVEPLVSDWRLGNRHLFAQQLLNRLQQPATEISSWIHRLQELFARHDCCGSLMSGSGSSYFALCRSASHARKIAHHLYSLRLGWVAIGHTLHEMKHENTIA
jgi:4-diphosphocytidyl-2-C-methyl-D-erythritol kinase